MADLPDLHATLPDKAHDDLRVAVLAALDDLAGQIERINRAYSLLLGSAHAAQGTLNVVASGQQQIAALNIRVDATRINADTALAGVDDLQERVAALEARVDALDLADELPGPDAAG